MGLLKNAISKLFASSGETYTYELVVTSGAMKIIERNGQGEKVREVSPSENVEIKGSDGKKITIPAGYLVDYPPSSSGGPSFYQDVYGVEAPPINFP